jgi:hypothetical protein
MRRTYVHRCDLRMVMKCDRTSDFSVGSPYSDPGATRPGGCIGCLFHRSLLWKNSQHEDIGHQEVTQMIRLPLGW